MLPAQVVDLSCLGVNAEREDLADDDDPGDGTPGRGERGSVDARKRNEDDLLAV